MASMTLSIFLDWEPAYHAAVALYLTITMYELPEPGLKKTWLDVLQVYYVEKFYGKFRCQIVGAATLAGGGAVFRSQQTPP